MDSLQWMLQMGPLRTYKGEQCKNHSPLGTSSATFEENQVKSRANSRDRVISDEKMKGSSWQYISELLIEVAESLQSRKMIEEMKDLMLVSCCETSSKITQSLVSESSTNPLETENEKDKSEILFYGLDLLADVAAIWADSE